MSESPERSRTKWKPMFSSVNPFTRLTPEGNSRERNSNFHKFNSLFFSVYAEHPSNFNQLLVFHPPTRLVWPCITPSPTPKRAPRRYRVHLNILPLDSPPSGGLVQSSASAQVFFPTISPRKVFPFLVGLLISLAYFQRVPFLYRMKTTPIAIFWSPRLPAGFHTVCS